MNNGLKNVGAKLIITPILSLVVEEMNYVDTQKESV
jgi:hypothetical protein